MKSKKLIVYIYAIFLIATSYWAYKVNFSTSDWLALIGVWVFVVVAMFALFDFIFKEREYKQKHSEDLVKEVFGHPATNGSVDYRYDEIRISNMAWVIDNDWLDYAKQHLKAPQYEIMCSAYINGEKYAKPLISQIVGKIEQYRDTVEQELTEAKIPLLLSEGITSLQKSHYRRDCVKHVIFKDALKSSRLEINESSEGLYLLCWSSQPSKVYTVARADKTSIEDLQAVIEKIEKDETIRAIILEIESLIYNLESNAALKLFEQGRKEIIRQVMVEKKPLKGKCDGCPD